MKRLIGAVMAVALLVSVAPVLAGDSFYALSQLPAGLSPLDDAQLAAVEGGDICVVCLEIAPVIQTNVSAVTIVLSEVEDFVNSQLNAAGVDQEIN